MKNISKKFKGCIKILFILFTEVFWHPFKCWAEKVPYSLNCSLSLPRIGVPNFSSISNCCWLQH